MKHVSLATRYRPQLFSEVAGQDLIKTVLSRAAAEDRVAPGYLFSGTRGVGKTTLARIFARALNCEHAPCAEPCNTCEQCRRITEGTHPDVVEIDGASNNKVDDARALRENVGFAPMEGRYKIFIIDEAHMLTPQAFNALLKTLEEPPPHVVFIFATTEIHKFLPTILSRCQVFSFRHLTEETITAHLGKILNLEGIPFEDSALHLIARRAAGSARDSMSLLDQVLSYGSESVNSDTVRTVLGLAGMDALATLFDALARHDCAAAAMFTRELVAREVDIGFFLRELVDYFRSLFLLRQCGRESVAQLGVSSVELDFLAGFANRFTPSYLHAAWQMLINAHRSVTTSPEPASALDLLLVNLALLPQLLPASLVADAAGAAPAGQLPSGPVSGPDPSAYSVAQSRPQQSTFGQTGQGLQQGQPAAGRQAYDNSKSQPAQGPAATPYATQAESARQQASQAPSAGPAANPAANPDGNPSGSASKSPAASLAQDQTRRQDAGSGSSRIPAGETPAQSTTRPVRQDAAPAAQVSPATPVQGSNHAAPDSPKSSPSAPGEVPTFAKREASTPSSMASSMPQPDEDEDEDEDSDEADYESMGKDLGSLLPDWDAFTDFAQGDKNGVPPYILKSLRCVSMQGDVLTLECDSESLLATVKRSRATLEASLSRFLGRNVRTEVLLSEDGRNRNQALHTPPVLDRPELRHCFEILNAHVDRVQQR